HIGSGASRPVANPLVTAYFRAADEAPESANEEADAADSKEEPLTGASMPASAPLPAVAALSADDSETLEAVMEPLTEVGVMPARPRALLEAAPGDPHAAGLMHLRRLMAYVRDMHEAAYFT